MENVEETIKLLNRHLISIGSYLAFLDSIQISGKDSGTLESIKQHFRELNLQVLEQLDLAASEKAKAEQ